MNIIPEMFNTVFLNNESHFIWSKNQYKLIGKVFSGKKGQNFVRKLRFFQ